MSDYWRSVFNQCIYDISHCYYCNFGGAGWKDDYKPFYFCGPQCIDRYNGFNYSDSYYDVSDTDEDYDYDYESYESSESGDESE